MTLLAGDTPRGVRFLAELMTPNVVTTFIVGNGLSMACGGPSTEAIKSYLVSQGGQGAETKRQVSHELLKIDRIARTDVPRD